MMLLQEIQRGFRVDYVTAKKLQPYIMTGKDMLKLKFAEKIQQAESYSEVFNLVKQLKELGGGGNAE